MSKGNMLLGHARGKVGDLVFARTGGQQVVRARASQVKNPKTQAQTIQRILLNTIAQAYSKMSPIVDHSFQGVQQGQKTMSKFMADNLKALRAKVAAAPSFASVYAFSPIGTQVFSTNDYIVSTGTLPTIGATLSQSGLTGIITIPASDNTYAAVAETLGLQRGDQITIIGIEGSYLSARFKYARIILDPTNTDGTSADWNAPFIDGGNINLPSARNEGDLASVLFVSDKISFTLSTPNSITSGAVIASRKNADGSWLRSSERLATIDPEELGENDLQSAIELSEEGSVNTASRVYLNNAGTGRLQSASNGSRFDDDIFEAAVTENARVLAGSYDMYEINLSWPSRSVNFGAMIAQGNDLTGASFTPVEDWENKVIYEQPYGGMQGAMQFRILSDNKPSEADRLLIGTWTAPNGKEFDVKLTLE